MEEYNFVCEKEDENNRIDSFLANEMDDFTRSAIQKLIENDHVKLNEKNIKSNQKIKYMDRISVFIPAPIDLTIEPEDITLDILFEDSEIIVINKPQGLVVHPAPGHYSGTVVNALLFHCKDELSGINGVLRPGIVHRIDKDTSGALVIAKTNGAHQSLAAQLASHSMTRKYVAIVYNNVALDEGTIDKPIGRHPIERKKMSVTEKHAKHAVTHYKVLERLGKYTLIQAELETGRTHQIRVHMASIGHAVLGDSVYGSKKNPYNLIGQALHAKNIGFIHPTKNEYMEFETELPEYFIKLLDRLRA